MDSNCCPICLETDADTKVDCCNNNFHKTCLTEWKNIKNTCPLCRKDLIKEVMSGKKLFIHFVDSNIKISSLVKCENSKCRCPMAVFCKCKCKTGGVMKLDSFYTCLRCKEEFIFSQPYQSGVSVNFIGVTILY